MSGFSSSQSTSSTTPRSQDSRIPSSDLGCEFSSSSSKKDRRPRSLHTPTGCRVDAYSGISSLASLTRSEARSASMDGTDGTPERRTSVFSLANESGVFERGGTVKRNAKCNAGVTRNCNATNKNYIPGWSRRRLRLPASLIFGLSLLAPFRPDGSREAAKS